MYDQDADVEVVTHRSIYRQVKAEVCRTHAYMAQQWLHSHLCEQ